MKYSSIFSCKTLHWNNETNFSKSSTLVHAYHIAFQNFNTHFTLLKSVTRHLQQIVGFTGSKHRHKSTVIYFQKSNISHRNKGETYRYLPLLYITISKLIMPITGRMICRIFHGYKSSAVQLRKLAFVSTMR